eukprot:Opistho-2@4313
MYVGYPRRLDRAVGAQTVDVDPFDGAGGREQLAVVEARRGGDPKVDRSAHHWGLHKHARDCTRRRVLLLRVLHRCPDPQRACVVRAKVLAHDKRNADALEARKCGLGHFRQRPFVCKAVDLGAGRALVRLVKVGRRIPRGHLRSLTRHHFGANFARRDHLKGGVQRFNDAVHILGYRVGRELARGSGLFALVGDLGKVRGKLVRGVKLVGCCEIKSHAILQFVQPGHEALGTGSPGAAERARDAGLDVHARRLQLVVALDLKGLDDGCHERCRVLNGLGKKLRVRLHINTSDLRNKAGGCGDNCLVGLISGHFGLQVVLFDKERRIARRKLDVRHAGQNNDGKLALRRALVDRVEDIVIVRLSNASDAAKTILLATNCERRRRIRLIQVLAEQKRAEKNLTREE